jgi:diguanylate cyclase (GGDEF)-like protein
LGVDVAAGLALIIALLFSLVNTIMGINRINWSRATSGEAIDLAISTFVVTALLFFGNLLFPGGALLPPIVLANAGMIAFLGFLIIRYRGRLITGFASRWMGFRGGRIDLLGEPVLVIGGGETGRFGIWLLRNSPLHQAFNLVGMVDDDPKKIGSRMDGLTVIGRTDEIPAIIEKYDVGLVLYAITEIDPAETERILELSKHKNTRIIMVPDVMDSLRAHFPSTDAEREELVGKVVQNSTLDRLTGVSNRQTFMNAVARELPRSLRYGHHCSLILFMVEYYWPDGAVESKAVTGQVLRVVAERTLKNIREIDVLGRFADTVFAILLPETDLEASNRVAERLYKTLTYTPVWTDRGSLTMSVSIGVVSQNEHTLDAASMLAAAESAMKIASNGN